MIYALRVPATIEDNDAVRVLEWHGQPGTSFAEGALIVEVETHKALIEVRATRPAVLRACSAAEGEWCALGGMLGLLADTADEALDGPATDLAADYLIG